MHTFQFPQKRNGRVIHHVCGLHVPCRQDASSVLPMVKLGLRRQGSRLLDRTNHGDIGALHTTQRCRQGISERRARDRLFPDLVVENQPEAGGDGFRGGVFG